MSVDIGKFPRFVEFSANREFCVKNLRRLVLDFYLRNCTIRNIDVLEKRVSIGVIDKISKNLLYPSQLIEEILETFRLDIKYYLRLVDSFKSRYNPFRLEKRLRIYLHKLSRIAPVFDYKRARSNIGSLLRLLRNFNFYPQLSTQIACIIYATDIKSKNNAKLMQMNIRTISGCSGYAFHKIRNKLNIDKLLKN